MLQPSYLVRDPKSKIVINTNIDELDKLKAARKKHQEFELLKRSVNELRNDVFFIKNLIKDLKKI